MNDVISPDDLLAWRLGAVLARICVYDERKEYAKRNTWILSALAMAGKLGMQVGIRIDPAEPEWPVVYIELPGSNGENMQVSWHLPQHPIPWDGHTTDEKYARIEAYALLQAENQT